ncbi:hypothetical protein OO013_14480 [Mangrovivirga sp. M17]|uniref:AtpZ/AtpI family protein n=1 Tax=Mangrovivirga halotolerans TaxID=2993936 RepID=A0ABT3RU05_9BACT|nr:hypothetical protein [Mangrovivirga halotolerans]MCX2745083.1 hypothetical protein [Mangrovivirga halotolerans]
MAKKKDYLKGYYLVGGVLGGIVSIVLFTFFGIKMLLGYEHPDYMKLITLLATGVFFSALSYTIYRSDR